MGDLTIGTKAVLSQSGSDEAVIASAVTGSPALTLTNATFPAGHVVQVVFSGLDPASTNTTVTTYQSTAIFQDIQKKYSSSRCLVTIAGGHLFQSSGFADGCISTICGQSSSTSFTHSTTYSSSDDPASGESMGMQQVYNASGLHSTSHSKQYFFASSGEEFESFRVFFKSRAGGASVIHETNHNVSITVMEIKQ